MYSTSSKQGLLKELLGIPGAPATRKSTQTDSVLGYKISTLVCFWTICFVATNVMSKQSWWQRCSGWCSPPQTDGDQNPQAPGMQHQWRLDHKPPNSSWGAGESKHIDLGSPMHLLPCQLSHNNLVLAFTSWKVKCASLSHLLDNQISWLFKPKCCESQDDKLKEHTHKAMVIAGAMGSNLSCNVY